MMIRMPEVKPIRRYNRMDARTRRIISVFYPVGGVRLVQAKFREWGLPYRSSETIRAWASSHKIRFIADEAERENRKRELGIA